ncbi:MAG: hypothetical protein ACT4P7_12155 [Gemmatimonadaceae bacterium]
MKARQLLAVAAVLATLPGIARAQDLPAAKDLIQTWATAVNASGWKGHKSARTTAAFDLPAMGISAKMESAQMFTPPMSVSKIDIPGMGEMRQGFDGTTSWSVNPMQGPSVTPKDLAEAQKEDNDPDNYSRTSPAIVSSETVEKTKLNDQDCFKVKHTWKSGRISHDCFSVADGMIVWSQTKTKTPMGELDVVTTFSAYKDFGGVKRATTTTVEQGGQQFVITLQSWEWDTVDPKEFALPPEIKALVEKKP